MIARIVSAILALIQIATRFKNALENSVELNDALAQAEQFIAENPDETA